MVIRTITATAKNVSAEIVRTKVPGMNASKLSKKDVKNQSTRAMDSAMILTIALVVHGMEAIAADPKGM